MGDAVARCLSSGAAVSSEGAGGGAALTHARPLTEQSATYRVSPAVGPVSLLYLTNAFLSDLIIYSGQL